VDTPQPTDLYSIGTLAWYTKSSDADQSLFVLRKDWSACGWKIRAALAVHAGARNYDSRDNSAKGFRGRSAAAQRADVVPADRGRFADAL